MDEASLSASENILSVTGEMYTLSGSLPLPLTAGIRLISPSSSPSNASVSTPARVRSSGTKPPS